MTTALIIAGGVGSRMGAEIPKQFVRVLGKPVVVYTLENFQCHPMVDRIRLVCVSGWQEALWTYARENGITKLDKIIDGGGTAQESIRNGIFSLEGDMAADDLVIIHDGVRPLIDTAIIDDILVKARKYGDGVTSMPYNEQIFIIDEEDPSTTRKYIARETLRRVATPQAYRFNLVNAAYHEAYEKGIGIYGSSYTNTMMVELGHTLHFAAGSDRNIKLTTPDDLAIFESYVLSHTK